jgi:hypothetical protein
MSRCQRSSGLRSRSAAVRLPRLWVRIPLEVWMFVCCECCVLSGRGLCDELITRPDESYRLRRCVWSRNLVNEEALAHWGLSRQNKQTNKRYYMTGVRYGGRVPISGTSLGFFASPACFEWLLGPIQSGFEAWPLSSFCCPRMHLVIHKDFKYVFAVLRIR